MAGVAVLYLVGTLIVLAIIYFMVVPHLRSFVFVLALIVGFGIYLVAGHANKENEQSNKQQVANEWRARNSIKPNDISLAGVSLVHLGSAWQLKGTITNNSKFSLDSIQFQVTIQDCVGQSCKIIAQEDTQTEGANIPAGQVRLFNTYSMEFKNMPPPNKALWDYKIIQIRAAL
jgi:hypothetical protein